MKQLELEGEIDGKKISVINTKIVAMTHSGSVSQYRNGY
jgi:hypothetical protein